MGHKRPLYLATNGYLKAGVTLMTERISNWGLVRLAARGQIHPHMQLTWREKNGIDPIHVAQTIWWHEKMRIRGIAVGLLVMALALLWVVFDIHLTPSVPLLIPSVLAGTGCLLTVAGAMVPKFAWDLFKWQQRTFNEEYGTVVHLLEEKAPVIGSMKLQTLKDKAVGILDKLAYWVLKHSEDDAQFESKLSYETKFRKSHRLFHDFDLVPGDYGSYYDRARTKLAAELASEATSAAA